ncbi:ammonium transporter [Ruficoccus sp. ZRK36]|uniref:ammonium transporter n=1 Tax=Ruficoccus sp. ZRK36 TaxID=2866311 RepID=UPI001C739E9D|nr:ammonium transporter [Ruficoccus sp. ZRK36]QYY35526.1 ammonium transporter [Ruficoccus sp. ZRK36]
MLWTAAFTSHAQEASAPAESPSLEERVAGLEAYMRNEDPAGSNVEGFPGPGHTGWMMTSGALVLFMTLPGLALFYGGMVREKNALSIAATCLGCAGVVTLLWWAVGYSLVFGTNFDSPFLGGSEYFFLRGVGAAPNGDYSVWISQSVFCIYQLTFAIITASLIFGSTAERIKFRASMCFVLVWMFVVYFPLAHMIWGSTGFMNGIGNADAVIPALDFAGGTVVHMSSGWSALILCILLGKRMGYGSEPMPPHNMVLCMVGTGMLWFGWYGFNAGSALAADGIAANAFMTTTLAAGVGTFTWGLMETLLKGKPSVLGFCSGAVGGLVVITPAAGYVDASGAVVLGIIAGIVPFFAVTYMKRLLGYDDALDAFGVHGVGGTLGAILTGVFATERANPALVSDICSANGLRSALEHHMLWLSQLAAVGLTIALATVATVIIGLILRATIGLRHSADDEDTGLDLTDHGEESYIYSSRG